MRAVLPQVKSYFMSLLEYFVTTYETRKDRQVNLKIRANSRYNQEQISNIILTASVNTTSIESSVVELKDICKMYSLKN
jgi:hypothetical protein